MAQANDSPTNLTRRAAMAGLAATATVPAVAVADILAEPDPIYAAIENYRQTVAAFEQFLSTTSEKAPEWEAGEDRHLDADHAAAAAFVTTTPTTLYGIVAAFAFVRAEHDRGNLCSKAKFGSGLHFRSSAPRRSCRAPGPGLGR